MLSAAASPEWIARSDALVSGDVTQRRFNAALRHASDRAAYPILVQVVVPLTESDRALSPVSGESGRLAELQAALAGSMGDRGVLAGTVADSRAWQFILYTGETSWLPAFEAQFRAAASDHQAGMGVREDKRWRVFRELCPPVRNRRRDRVLAWCVLPLFGALGTRYGIVWGVAGVAAILAWMLPLALNKTDLLAAQLAHPARAFAFVAYLLATIAFGGLALFWGPGSPWIRVAGPIVVGVIVTAACWPAQRKFYARMRARAAMRAPQGPAGPQ